MKELAYMKHEESFAGEVSFCHFASTTIPKKSSSSFSSGLKSVGKRYLLWPAHPNLVVLQSIVSENKAFVHESYCTVDEDAEAIELFYM